MAGLETALLKRLDRPAPRWAFASSKLSRVGCINSVGVRKVEFGQSPKPGKTRLKKWLRLLVEDSIGVISCPIGYLHRVFVLSSMFRE